MASSADARNANENTHLLVNNTVQTQRSCNVITHRHNWSAFFACIILVGNILYFSSSSTSNISIQEASNHQNDLTKIIQANSNGEYADFFKTMNTMIDNTIDPCTDFYQYACGGWLEQTTLTSNESYIDSAFSIVQERNTKIIEDIIASRPPVISEFYDACMAAPNRDTDGISFVANLIDGIHSAASIDELMFYAGELNQAFGIQSFFTVTVGPDPTNPSLNVLTLLQGGITLPSEEYYLDESKKSAFLSLFQEYVVTMVDDSNNLMQINDITQYVNDVFETEASLAAISESNADLRDPWATDNRYSIRDIEAQYPFLWDYLQGTQIHVRYPEDIDAIIMTPSFFDKQNAMLARDDDYTSNSSLPDDLPLEKFKHYLSFHVLNSFSFALGEDFRKANHIFFGALAGISELPDRTHFCRGLTTSFLGGEIGRYYMKKVFTPLEETNAESLVTEIEGALRELLQQEKWLDEPTYMAAMKKLDHVRNFIGGPNVDSSGSDDSDDAEENAFGFSSDDFFQNILNILELSAYSEVQAIGSQVDPTEWDMFPSTVNAYYDPSGNKMVFPAAILQPPFYDSVHFPREVNYARIGLVMGHELTHGFDDQGRDYDYRGRLKNWWTPKVSKSFQVKAQCLASQYSSFPVKTADNVLLGYVNGNLTLGENIADNGGLHLAYQAYKLKADPHWQLFRRKSVQEVEEQHDDAKIFFTAYAQLWCEKATPAYSQMALDSDPHSPGRWRVNGPLQNYKPFSKAFKCPSGSPMNPVNKCIVW